MHELTREEATLLAHLLNHIRPDWTTNSLMTILANNRQTPSLADLTIAATTKAKDPTCKTPAPIFHPGNHWPPQTRQQIPTGPECPDHTGHPATTCGPCTTDIQLGDRPPHMHGKALTPHKRNPPPKNWRNNPTPTGLNTRTNVNESEQHQTSSNCINDSSRECHAETDERSSTCNTGQEGQNRG